MADLILSFWIAFIVVAMIVGSAIQNEEQEKREDDNLKRMMGDE